MKKKPKRITIVLNQALFKALTPEEIIKRFYPEENKPPNFERKEVVVCSLKR